MPRKKPIRTRNRYSVDATLWRGRAISTNIESLEVARSKTHLYPERPARESVASQGVVLLLDKCIVFELY